MTACGVRMTEAAMAMVAARFRLLADSARLRLLVALRDGERTVSDLARAARIPPSGASRHLTALLDAGLVVRRKAGSRAYYRLADPTVFVLCERVCRQIEAVHDGAAHNEARS